MPEPTRYRAFISYSHADKAIARKLHRQLEGYAMPKRLVGGTGSRGNIPARLTPIFRDIDELPASDDLSAEIKAALAASDALIVLCSPAAFQSEWVAREIDLFKALHGQTRPILAAVVAGDPQAVLPAALKRQADPVAADFRKGQDGTGLALLKLVAGLTGASLSTLVQRDAQRQVRRVMAITAAALIAMLITGSLMIMAMRAKAEAQHQRAEAEGLIEYMLTDLRDRLKGVGRLDVMGAVNARAMTYYDDAPVADMSFDSLERRARILHAMGEDEANDAKYGSALEKFSAAHRVTGALLAQKPNDPEAIFTHAQSEYWVGFAAWKYHQPAKTERHWKGYLDLARRLERVEPHTVRTAMELGYAFGNLCELHTNLDHEYTRAMQECERSVRYEESAYSLLPNDKNVAQSLANRYGWLANVYTNSGKFDAALIERKKELEIISDLLSKDPKNIAMQLRAIWSNEGVAIILANQLNHRDAILAFRDAVKSVNYLLEKTGERADILTYKLKLLVALIKELRVVDDPSCQSAIEEAKSVVTKLKQTKSNLAAVQAYENDIGKIKNGGKK
jgi:tetratricopeptide (TPR) repeat protein